MPAHAHAQDSVFPFICVELLLTVIHKDDDCPVFSQTTPAITAFGFQARSLSPLISLYKFNMTHKLACHVIFQRKLAVVRFFWETVLTK